MKTMPDKNQEQIHSIANIEHKDVIMLLSAALIALQSYEDELNRLNVYPVPDGDTGTNMVQTMQTVVSEVSKEHGNSLQKLAPVITYGSLMGARGNSGVILSQIIRGICEVIEQSDEITSSVITQSMKNGADIAYSAVKKPVEGTMLTVIRDMADAAINISGNGINPLKLLEYVNEEGRRSVERTPLLLPVLKEAGVVDAGGYGLVIMTQGIIAALRGERPVLNLSEDTGNITVGEEEITFTYCTEFIIKSNGLDMGELEKQLDTLGDSLLVVGTDEITKIHIHTNQPGDVLNLATTVGTITNVQINNIKEQSAERAKAIRAESEMPDMIDLIRDTQKEIGIVAVANGEGVKNILLSLGVDRVISGGQSMNPSTAQILAAVNDVPAKQVFILPNNKNIIMTAQQVASLTEKTIRVIPTRSIPEAFASLSVYDPEKPAEFNEREMSDSLFDIKTGELTCAIRDDVDGRFKHGDFIGLYDGEIRVFGKELEQTMVNLICDMIDEFDETITVLTGDQVPNDTLDEMRTRLEHEFADKDIDLHKGDQPIYHVIIGIE